MEVPTVQNTSQADGAVGHALRLILFLRLFLRVFAFAYSLFLTVMYNYWFFMGLPGSAWIGYIALMALWEFVSGVFMARLPMMALLKAYIVLTLIFEFPSVLLNADPSTVIVFLPWVSLWYGSLIVLALLVVLTSRRR